MVERICDTCKGRRYFESCLTDLRIACLECHGTGVVMGPDDEECRRMIDAVAWTAPQGHYGEKVAENDLGPLPLAPEPCDTALHPRMPFPVFHLGPEDETTYETYHRAFKDGWRAGIEAMK